MEAHIYMIKLKSKIYVFMITLLFPYLLLLTDDRHCDLAGIQACIISATSGGQGSSMTDGSACW